MFANELHNADLAMYEAKRSDGNKLVCRAGEPSQHIGKARRDQKVTSIARRSNPGGKSRRTGTD